jgi:L,D-transpeptidase ErfK/SrfK
MTLNFKIKNYAPVCTLLCGLLLTACQNSPPIVSEPAPVKYYHNLETHNFSINKDQNLIGSLAAIKTQANDTLPDIARHFGLGHNDIISANPEVDPWLPEPDTQVLLPLTFLIPDVPRQGIVLNLANMRMFYFPQQNPKKVATYPVGIGRDGWDTPQGLTKIISKTKNPVWNVPPSIQQEHAKKGDPLPSTVPAGPNNPLGEYAMRLALGSYLVHGTNKPYGVGMQMSHGCLNLYPEDIKILFNDTKVGTQVTIVEQPYLIGYDKGMLFLEAHKPLQAHKNFRYPLFTRIRELAKKHKLTIDWSKVEQILTQATGVPTPIMAQGMNFKELADSAFLVAHPERFYGQPVPKQFTTDSWTVTAASIANERTARKLAALLNHQGPTIPAKAIQQGELFHVVAGPFTNNKEAKTALKRIYLEFELKGKINPPQSLANQAVAQSDIKTPPIAEVPTQESSFFDDWFN